MGWAVDSGWVVYYWLDDLSERIKAHLAGLRGRADPLQLLFKLLGALVVLIWAQR